MNLFTFHIYSSYLLHLLCWVHFHFDWQPKAYLTGAMLFYFRVICYFFLPSLFHHFYFTYYLISKLIQVNLSLAWRLCMSSLLVKREALIRLILWFSFWDWVIGNLVSRWRNQRWVRSGHRARWWAGRGRGPRSTKPSASSPAGAATNPASWKVATPRNASRSGLKSVWGLLNFTAIQSISLQAVAVLQLAQFDQTWTEFFFTFLFQPSPIFIRTSDLNRNVVTTLSRHSVGVNELGDVEHEELVERCFRFPTADTLPPGRNLVRGRLRQKEFLHLQKVKEEQPVTTDPTVAAVSIRPSAVYRCTTQTALHETIYEIQLYPMSLHFFLRSCSTSQAYRRKVPRWSIKPTCSFINYTDRLGPTASHDEACQRLLSWHDSELRDWGSSTYCRVLDVQIRW